jgi:hypothetical protein
MLEVGVVEALIAIAFFAVCAATNWLLHRPPSQERELSKILDQIGSPQRNMLSQLSYRGVPYAPQPLSPSKLESAELTDLELTDLGLHPDESAPIQSIPTNQTPRSVVRLTYRGVPYIQLCTDESSGDSSEAES